MILNILLYCTLLRAAVSVQLHDLRAKTKPASDDHRLHSRVLASIHKTAEALMERMEGKADNSREEKTKTSGDDKNKRAGTSGEIERSLNFVETVQVTKSRKKRKEIWFEDKEAWTEITNVTVKRARTFVG